MEVYTSYQTKSHGDISIKNICFYNQFENSPEAIIRIGEFGGFSFEDKCDYNELFEIINGEMIRQKRRDSFSDKIPIDFYLSLKPLLNIYPNDITLAHFLDRYIIK